MSTDRAHRLWRQVGLRVPRRRPRRKIATGRPRPLPPTGIGHVWTYDFVFDAGANGQQLKCLTVLDEYSRECLAIDVARAILRWLGQANIETAYIDPGKPWQNAAGESFNGKFRDEGLSLEWFRNRIDAKIMIEGRRRHCNQTRPHSSLSYLTPAEFKQLSSKTNPEESIFKE